MPEMTYLLSWDDPDLGRRYWYGASRTACLAEALPTDYEPACREQEMLARIGPCPDLIGPEGRE